MAVYRLASRGGNLLGDGGSTVRSQSAPESRELPGGGRHVALRDAQGITGRATPLLRPGLRAGARQWIWKSSAPNIAQLNERLARRRQAVISSGSRSGSSATTSSGDSPSARRSRTSVTRIRSPRTHGRPPHCSAFTVIRLVIVLMVSPTATHMPFAHSSPLAAVNTARRGSPSSPWMPAMFKNPRRP